jgi:hypothetical protein
MNVAGARSHRQHQRLRALDAVGGDQRRNMPQDQLVLRMAGLVLMAQRLQPGILGGGGQRRTP